MAHLAGPKKNSLTGVHVLNDAQNRHDFMACILPRADLRRPTTPVADPTRAHVTLSRGEPSRWDGVRLGDIVTGRRGHGHYTETGIVRNAI